MSLDLFIPCNSQLTVYHRSIVNDVLSECQALALQQVKWLLDMENAAPFTLNEHYYKDYRDKFINHYRNERFPPLPVTSCSCAMVCRQSPCPCAVCREAHVARERRIANDPFAPALHHMASTRSYFQGSHRFWPQLPANYLSSLQLLSSGSQIWSR